MPSKGAGSIWQYPDPAIRETIKLQNMVSEYNVQAPIKEQIDLILKLQIGRLEFCEMITTGASKDLEQVEQETISHPWDRVFEAGKTSFLVKPRMLSGNGTAQLLKSLISLGNCRKALEIGSLTGYGALAMAEALPADGCVVSCEYDPYIASLAQNYMDKSMHGQKIKIKTGDAKKTLLDLAEEKEMFDIVFMDADKPSYIDYYNLLLERNILAKRGTIVVDNALFYGGPYSEVEFPAASGKSNADGMKKFNEYVANDNRVHRVLLPVADGVMIIRRKETIDGSI